MDKATKNKDKITLCRNTTVQSPFIRNIIIKFYTTTCTYRCSPN